MNSNVVDSKELQEFVQSSYDAQIDALAKLLEGTNIQPLNFAKRKDAIDRHFKLWCQKLKVNITYRDIIKRRSDRWMNHY
jgi:hypothetical protein